MLIKLLQKLGTLVSSRVGHIVIALLIGLGIGRGLYRHYNPPIHEISVIHDTKTVQVEKPVITTQVVDKVVKDPEQLKLIKNLIKVNNDLNLKLINVQSTVATNVTVGEGQITPVQTEANPSILQFKDYQLTATFVPPGFFKYELNQKFRIVSTTGYNDKLGLPETQSRIFQETPNGPVELKAESVSIFADQRTSRWMASPRIQAGLGVDQDGKGAVVALQWLKHGKGPAAEDTTYAILSPGVQLNSNTKEFILLPVSINLGQIKHNPFTNLWLSPTVATNKSLGISLVATF